MRIKKYTLIFFLLGFVKPVLGQNDIVASINNIQGIWRKDYDTKSELVEYMIIKNNKSILVSFRPKLKTAKIFGNPFAYLGFWDIAKQSDNPKNIAQLEQSGNQIFFYDFAGIDYDKYGNILSDGRSYGIKINDNSGSSIPSYFNLYHSNSPDTYETVKSISNNVLFFLHQNPKDWKLYVDFMGIEEKRVTAAKAAIFKTPANDQLTKMYLIKGDEVEILQQNNLWVKIRYYGKTTIEGWIKKKDIE